MSGIPTESRIFADRYLRETRRLEKLHANQLSPGTANWSDALRGLSQRLGEIGSPIKRVAALRGIVDYLNGLGAASEQIRHIALHYGQTSRTAVFSFATFTADPNPLHGSGDEDGLNMLMHQIRTGRQGVELIANLNIAFVSRHAIGRLHQRTNELSGWGFGAVFMLVGVLGFITRRSEAHSESALHLLCQDVLLVGASRPALKTAASGENVDATLYEVRTALPADEVKSHSLEQGRLAASAAFAWLRFYIYRSEALRIAGWRGLQF